MKSKTTLKEFTDSISINTKFYILTAVLLAVFGNFYSSSTSDFVIPSIATLIVLFAIENYMLFSKKYPYIWRVIKWCTIGAIILTTLIGFRI